ncbi:hypothetical protein B0J14DRAFT_706417 [Halenospora varia]|nr:hypothetical protein B0J14DRAFT_706417 [Halenospora varia]
MKQWVLKKPYLEIKGNLLEAPFYDEQTGQARFIDIIEKVLYTFQPSKGPESLKKIKTQETIGVTANLHGSNSEIIAGARHGLAKLNPTTGSLSYLCKFWPHHSPEISQKHATSPPPSHPLSHSNYLFTRMRSNDGAVDSRGRFWVGTLNEQPATPSTKPEGVLFRIDPDLTIHTMLSNLHAPNGIGWNLSDTIMYFTDSTTSNVYSFSFDSESGAISNQRVFFHVQGDDEFPDGLVVDREDCVWTALWGGGKALRIDAGGRVVGEVILPTAFVTCPVFVGTELLITTRGDPGREGDSIERGGDVYMVDVGVRGAMKRDFVLS